MRILVSWSIPAVTNASSLRWSSDSTPMAA